MNFYDKIFFKLYNFNSKELKDVIEIRFIYLCFGDVFVM